MRKLILPILLLLTIPACSVSSEGSVTVQQVPKSKPIPFGLSQERAKEYQLQPDIIYAYAWVGYDSSRSPQEQVEAEWPHFGQVTETQDLGPLLQKSGTLVRCTVKKYDFWKEAY